MRALEAPLPDLPRIPANTAARLFLQAQGLLEDPLRSATRRELRKLIHQLGFLQLDSINVVARAQAYTCFARQRGFEDAWLAELQTQGNLFEGWTHDASLIPVEHYPHWRPRWRADKARIEAHPWWQQLLGPDSERICGHVLERITAEGPLGSADFDHPEKRGPWWGWKPQKAALDYLWRTGQLAVSGRINFHKRYDLPERVLPKAHALPEPDPEMHLEWACGTAAEGLVCFTPKELAAHWNAVDGSEARAWCREATKTGRLLPVEVESRIGGSAQPAFILADWESRLRKAPEAPSGLRFLAPFDPVLRDRNRALHRFGFDYRFEAFTPEAKRTYGYYVLPILEGERLIGRMDPKLHRDRGLLEVKGLWWEPGIKPTKARLSALDEALAHLADFVGATEYCRP